MNKRILFLTLMLVILPFVVAACGGDISEDDAEKAVKAAFEGKVDEANKYICDDDKINEEEFELPEGSEIKIDKIECKKDGDKMNCDYTVSFTMEGTTTPISQSLSFDIKDGKLCGGDMGVQ